MRLPIFPLAMLAVAALAGGLALPRLLDGLGLRKKNFKGEMIPAAYGAQIAFFAIMGCVLLRLLDCAPQRIIALYAIEIAGMAALGFVDDLFGTRETGGFRGHFEKLILERKLTTGAFKALSGGVLALALGALVSKSLGAWVVNSLLIALSANALNLLDLRPGRALAAFFFGLIAVSAACGFLLTGIWPLVALMPPTVVLGFADVRGRAMMGDTGSNPLGGALGLTLAIDGGMPAKLVAIAVLLGLHVLCERYSLSQIIERNAILRRLDSLLGVR